MKPFYKNASIADSVLELKYNTIEMKSKRQESSFVLLREYCCVQCLKWNHFSSAISHENIDSIFCI